MDVLVLQSGSSGNCIYVESGGVAVLLDAGITARQVQFRLAQFGKDLGRVRAVVISHGHRDHIGSAGVYQRKLALPVWLTHSASRRTDLDKSRCSFFAPGDTLKLEEHLVVETIPTPHDSPHATAFVVSDGKHRLAVLTDLGHPFGRLDSVLDSVDAAIVESNYDPVMLEDGEYPEELKERIRGPGGHLSNREAALLLKRHARRLRWVCLAHLSQHNNAPEIALATYRHVIRNGEPFLADYYGPTPLPGID